MGKRYTVLWSEPARDRCPAAVRAESCVINCQATRAFSFVEEPGNPLRPRILLTAPAAALGTNFRPAHLKLPWHVTKCLFRKSAADILSVLGWHELTQHLLPLLGKMSTVSRAYIRSSNPAVHGTR